MGQSSRDNEFTSSLFDTLVDAGTSPQAIIDGGFKELVTDITAMANNIAELVWDEAIKRIKENE